MASDQEYVDFIVEQMSSAGEIIAKKMFGEYGVYCDKKIIGLICQNQLFVKPTEGGRTYIGDVVEAPPYEGAKLSLLIEEQAEDREWLGELIKITFNELPAVKPKKPKKKKDPKK